MLRERLDEIGNADKYAERQILLAENVLTFTIFIIFRFEKFMNTGFFQRMITEIRPIEPIAVLCHGDCWTNNLLFRYGDDGTITDVMIL